MPAKGTCVLTPAEQVTLSDLYAQMPLREVAKRMGRTYGSCQWHVQQLGLHKTFAQFLAVHEVTATPEQLSYVAGLIDGEGTVSIRQFTKKWKPTVRIANTCWPLMEWLLTVVPGPSAYIEHRKLRGTDLQCYMFHFNGLGHLNLYEALLPRLIIKRAQMECVVEFTRERLTQDRLTSLTARQQELIATVRNLNIGPSARFRAERSATSRSTT